jgi:nucleoside-diphosphate-sugar epimerase
MTSLERAFPVPSDRTVLVLGATGGLGGAVAERLAARGWSVAAMVRDPARAARGRPNAPWRWNVGDAMVPSDVLAAASGARWIVHAVNPAGYRNWRGLALPMLANTVAAAEATGARILFPGNVYNFGADAGSRVDEAAPQNPVTRKGRVRIEMEALLRDAAGRGVRSLVVRAGDFFGPGLAGSWFAGLVAKEILAHHGGGREPRSVAYPAGNPEAGHAWAYVPDLAETMVRLLERDRDLAPFEVFHFGGHWVEPGLAMATAAAVAAGRPDLPVKTMAWWPLVLLSPFNTFMREVLEMRYLWERPLRLDNRKLVAFLGHEPHTPLDQAVRAAIGHPQPSPGQAVTAAAA